MSFIVKKATPLDQSHWIPDHLVTLCMSCCVVFTAFKRKHHCRKCGGVFCSECCPSSTELRICTLCEKTSLSVEPPLSMSTQWRAQEKSIQKYRDQHQIRKPSRRSNLSQFATCTIQPLSPKSSEIVPPPRKYHIAAQYENNIFIFGGIDGKARPLGYMWMFNLETLLWSKIPQFNGPVSLQMADSTQIGPNRCLWCIFGGSIREGHSDSMSQDTWIIDLEKTTESGSVRWEKCNITSPSAPQRRNHATIAHTSNSSIALFGGRVTANDQNTWIGHIRDSTDPSKEPSESYIPNVATEKGPHLTKKTSLTSLSRYSIYWQKLSTMNPRPHARQEHCAAYVPSFKSFVITGGEDRSSQVSDTWIINPQNSLWTLRGDSQLGIPPPNSAAAAIVIDNCLLLVGGHTGSGLSGAMLLLDFAENTWGSIASDTSLPPCAEHKIVYFGDPSTFCIVGGISGNMRELNSSIVKITIKPIDLTKPIPQKSSIHLNNASSSSKRSSIINIKSIPAEKNTEKKLPGEILDESLRKKT